ncbi:uncharacterized protein LOC100273748 [Zea mays]|uniref:F-box domain containing protein n=2 Tax=Zea mays TaxID=4577 RepID=B6SK84_MAIZE|nr:uncharacterized protein LOC100273748 [Zea mays]ACG25267.1 F-box domain containing protein [Zea mays]ONM52027.1 F-box domain containing protein [Zea mays]|eukprot:NP_001141628.3 uncharacterized LOC100273748 [Zea mays]
MAGRRRRCVHPRQARLLPLPSPGVPSPLESNTLREVAVAESPSKKICHALSSTPSSAPGPDVWVDLLDSLLLQIIVLVSSFHDLLAFIGTCRSWRAVLSSLPPVYTFNIPPLHLRSDGCDSHPHRWYMRAKLLSDINWQLTDPAKQTSSLSCSALQDFQVYMRYLGCSYGYLIFSNLEQCLLVNVYSGATVRPPKLKFTDNRNVYHGALVAPINLSNSCLLFCSRSSIFQWKVGSDFWSEHPLGVECISQIVSFKGEIFAIDLLRRLHRIQLEPQLSLQEVAVVWDADMFLGLDSTQWLVVCGDMLLMVHLSVTIDSPCSGFSETFNVCRLDFQVEPAKWVKVDNMGDNALFVGTDGRSPTFSCLGPEKWGGKRNCIYIASPLADSNEPWGVFEVGQAVRCYNAKKYLTRVHSSRLPSLWVLPSLVYGVGQ